MNNIKAKIFNQEIKLNKFNLIIGDGDFQNAFHQNNINQINDEQENTLILRYLCPEYNLNPKQQRERINNIIDYLNNPYNNATNIVMFTHSPYIINWLGCLVKAGNLYDKFEDTEYENHISKHIDKNISIRNKGLSVFELNSENVIVEYKNTNGLPPDEDYLNNELIFTNDTFSDLLEIQQNIEIQSTLKK